MPTSGVVGKGRKLGFGLLRRGKDAELSHLDQIVPDIPVLDRLPVGEAHDANLVLQETPAGRRHAHEVALAGTAAGVALQPSESPIWRAWEAESREPHRRWILRDGKMNHSILDRRRRRFPGALGSPSAI